MTESIGTYYVDLRPNAEGFIERMRGPILPQIDELGREAGRRFSSSFGDEVSRRISDVLPRSRPNTDRQSRENGRAAGDAFGREMDARITAAIRALPNIRVDADTDQAEAKLAEIRAGMASLAEKRIKFEISDEDALARLAVLRAELDELTSRDNRIRVRVNAGAAAAELAALRGSLGDLDEVGKKADESKKHVSLLFTSLLTLGPAIIPIAGAAAAAGVAAVAGLGVVALAVGGVKDAMKAGTPVGAQYGAALGVLKSDFSELKATAASGVLDGFDRSVDSVSAKLPSLNSDVAAVSAKVGDIGAHVVGGIAGGFQTFEPVISHVLDYVDKLAGKFEGWASGPGGSKFAGTLIKDFDQVAPLLANIATDAVHLVAAFAPAGGTSLSFLTTLTGLVGGLPVGVLKAGTTAYIAFKVAVATSAGITAATTALRGFATAETEAAVASTRLGGAQGGAAAAGGLRGLAGGMATVISRATPYIAAWVGIAYATKTGTNALGDYEHQMSSTKAIAGSTLKTLGDVFTFHWSDIGRDLGGYERQQGFAANVRQMQADIQSTLGGARELNSILDQGSSAAVSQYFASRPKVGQGLGPLLPSATWNQQTADTINQYHRSASAIAAAAKEADRTVAAAQREYDLIRANVAKGSYEAGAESYDAKDKLDAAKAAAGRLHNAYLALIELQGKARADTAALDKFRLSYAQANQSPKAAANSYILDTAPSYTAATTGLQSYQKSLDSASTAEAKWNAITIQGGKVTSTTQAALDEWNRALASTNGNVAAATALVLAHQDAYRQDQRDIALATVEQDRINSATAAAATRYKLTADQVQLYGSVLGVTARQLADGSVSQADFVTGVGQVERVVSSGGQALSGYIAAVAQFEGGLDTAATRAQLLGSAMVALNGDAISYGNAGAAAASANQQLVDDFGKLKKGVLDLKTGMLDYHNAGAQPVLADLAQLQGAAQTFASATYQDEVATKGRTQAAKDAASVYYNDTHGALIAEASQLGLTHDQAKKLADQYFHWPKNARTQIEQLGGEQVKTLLSGILQDLDQMTGNHHLNIDVTASASPIAQKALNALGSTGRAIHLVANGGIMDFYAAGGVRENHVAQIARAGAMRIWAEPETGGEAYIPLAAAKRGRSRDIAGEVVGRLGGMVHWFESGGFTGVTKPPPPKGTGSGSGSNSSTTHTSAAATDYSTVRTDITALWSALYGATAQLVSAENALTAAARRAGATDAMLAQLKTLTTRLGADSTELAATTSEIAKTRTYLAGLNQAAAQYRSQVISAGLGQFDITSAGVRTSTYTDRAAPGVSVGTITADAKAAADRSALEKTQLARLHAMGINSTLYHQLATGDPAQEAAQLAALAKATPAQIRALNAQYGRLTSTTSSLAGTVADQRYGGQIAAAQGLLNGFDPTKNPALAAAVHALANRLFGAGQYVSQGLAEGLTARRGDILTAMHNLAASLVAQLKRDLGIHSPSQVMRWHGQMVAKGFAEGIHAELPAVREAAQRMAVHAVPAELDPVSSSRGRSGLGAPSNTFRPTELHVVDARELHQLYTTWQYHQQAQQAFAGAI